MQQSNQNVENEQPNAAAPHDDEQQAPARRPKSWHEHIFAVLDYFSTESALTLYLLIHWIISCAIIIKFPENDTISFIAFVYFVSLLFAFISIMSRTNIYLLPLILFTAFGIVILFMLIYFSLIFEQKAYLMVNICNREGLIEVCKVIQESNKVQLLIILIALDIFFLLTSMAISRQVVRNSIPLPPHHPNAFYLYPNMVPHPTVIVGPVDLDEPPRYSVIEQVTQTNPPPRPNVNTETSPPRYSYWERTFGKKKPPTATPPKFRSSLTSSLSQCTTQPTDSTKHH
ncbi:unnamed protein product [Caenorhabditis bovis]|uniref:Uncharacterized protein n=1 Tax=Caenorhabditis bovis TaxID=2654633 RepID=A0A8S1ERG0_9PELO|nr:unnamed protein product [Caenorhabditis bovis]